MKLFNVVLQRNSGVEEIEPWRDENGIYYVFLPGYVEMKELQVIVKTDSKISINGIAIKNDFLCNDLVCNIPYEVEYTQFGMKKKSQVIFVRSKGVAAMFLETESGSIEYIHENKEYEERGTIALYTESGKLSHQGTIESIHGRGDYTWKFSEKKPYNIKLSDEADLLGMGKAQKWILLANAADTSHMRNKIVYDFADKIGLAYSPESQWVNVYLNGEYRGLYLLSEAIEIGTNRVDISPTEGAILAVELESVLQEKNDTYFVTDAGVAVEIRSPQILNEEKIVDLSSKVQSVENAILSVHSVDPVSGNSLQNLIDLDSWVKRYLIEEIFGNHDALMRSTYFYYSDGLIQMNAGPVWDYDLSIGNENAWQLQQVQSFWANRSEWAPAMETPWFYTLYQKVEFYQRMVEIYQSVYIPELDHLLNVTIYEYAEMIAEAASLDRIRWNEDSSLAECVQVLLDYMEQRIVFLNAIWLEERDYHVVRAVQQWGGYYAHYVVFTGERLSVLPEFEDKEDASFVGWYDKETGEPFDITKPIMKDIDIYAKWEDNPFERVDHIIQLIPLGLILLMGVVLVAVDFCRWK